MNAGKLLQDENERLMARKQYVTERLSAILAESNRLVEEADKIDATIAANEDAIGKLQEQL